MSDAPKGIEQFKAKYSALSPKAKKSINISLAVFAMILLCIGIYYSSGLNKKVVRREPTVTVSAKNFAEPEDRNTSIKLGVDKKVNTLMERIEQLEKAQKAPASEPQQMPSEVITGIPPVPSAAPATPAEPQRIERRRADFGSYAPEYVEAKPQKIERTVGGIGHVSVPVAKKDETKKEERAKKVNYIPSNSIFKAMLITGVYAPTLAAGKQNPSPVMLRLQDLSFFPNEIRRNLSGCFVGGEAFGNLSEERVQIRLLNLSCLSPNADKVVDTPVQGYVQGEDGVVALSGRVVSKEGRAAAVAFLAAFLQGLGGGISEASTTETITPLGGTTSLALNEGELLKYGVGKGMEGSFKELAKYYIAILNEIAPVIEVMGGREVELVITKGVELKMEDWEWTGIKD
jgi:conjugal transfer pilus assembly protein TraB